MPEEIGVKGIQDTCGSDVLEGRELAVRPPGTIRQLTGGGFRRPGRPELRSPLPRPPPGSEARPKTNQRR